MYNLAYRMMNNREDAEDILQESFTEAFRKLKSFRYESTFGSWIKSIVINKSINQLRKRKVEFTCDDFIDEPIEEEDTAPDLKRDMQKVFDSIQKLPSGYRLVLTLYLLEGYDHKEIAGILDISESTSKSQYLRAKLRLKQLLMDKKLSWTN
jgi:RNA polymerase sigma-70 factor (ECF subfamily)